MRKVYLNKGVPLALGTRLACKNNGIILLKRRRVQKVPGIVINHGNAETIIQAPVIINHPNYIYQSGVRTTAQLADEFVPETRFNWQDVRGDKDFFPFIAKNNGMKGRGKVVVRNESHLKELIEAGFVPTRYSIFTRFIAPPSLEYRILTYHTIFVKGLYSKPASQGTVNFLTTGLYR